MFPKRYRAGLFRVYTFATIDAWLIFNDSISKVYQIVNTYKVKNSSDHYLTIPQTSYVTVPPDVAGWRRVTFDIAPVADKIQTALGPFWENDIIFEDTSWDINA